MSKSSAPKNPSKTIEQKLADLERRKKKLEIAKQIRALREQQKTMK